MEDWAFLTFEDGSEKRVFEEEFVFGIAEVCPRHCSIARGSPGLSSCRIKLLCDNGGTVSLDEQEETMGERDLVAGGNFVFQENDKQMALNVSVLKGLPRDKSIVWGKVLGIGSQAEVKQCFFNDGLRAAKIFHKQKPFLEGKTIAECLDGSEREVEMLQQIRHPFIVTLHQVLSTQFHFILILDYCNGGDLCDLINKGPIPCKRSIFGMMSESVAFLHRHQICHRDIKPSNFLVQNMDEGEIKVLLTDFGTASFFSKRSHHMHRLVKTPLYCAPELLESFDYYTNAIDVFSLGVCFYNVWTDGDMPFQTEDEIRCGKFEPVQNDIVQELLEGMLCVDSLKRWSMDQVMESKFLLMIEERFRHPHN